MPISLVLSTLLLLSGSAPQADGVDRGGASDVQSSEHCSDQSGSAVATFEDENLEVAVRSGLSVGERVDLTCGLVSELQSLVAKGAGIENLNGIQNLTGLEHLDLWDNAVTDISALVGLTSLAWLDLGKNSIADLSALGGLTDVGYLSLANNEISDVGALAGLASLTLLRIRENEITDISAIDGLSQLTNLDISYNNISDISALSGLTKLTTLRVYNNPISDIDAMRGLTSLSELHVHDLPDLATIQPLVENTGLGKGDRVFLFGSNVPCSDIRALKDKGVPVRACVVESLLHWWWATLLAVGSTIFVTELVRRRNERRWAAWRAAAQGQGLEGSARDQL